jgi:CRP/FNR family cyclic AMP-dependent transcriptional regulator
MGVPEITPGCDACHRLGIGFGVRVGRGEEKARGTMANPFRLVTPAGRRTIWRGVRAPKLSGLEPPAETVTYPSKGEALFCDLPAAAAERLASITSIRSYPKGTVLFAEGQEPSGVFLIRQGRVRLYFRTAAGRAMILTSGGPRDALDVPAAVSGKPYEISAEAIDSVEADFITRQDFLDLLRNSSDAAVCVARHLTEIHQWLLTDLQRVGLTRSTEERFAWLLLNRCTSHEKRSVRLKLSITPDEIGLMIGASRASVERLLRHLKRRRLVQVKGPTLVIRSRAGIEKLAGQP